MKLQKFYLQRTMEWPPCKSRYLEQTDIAGLGDLVYSGRHHSSTCDNCIYTKVTTYTQRQRSLWWIVKECFSNKDPHHRKPANINALTFFYLG